MRYRTKIEILRINGLRSLSATLAKRKDPGVGALGAANKMFWSEMHRDAMELALDIFGAQSLLTDAGPADGGWPATMRGTSVDRLPGQPDALGVLLLAVGDDLGRDGRDPAQHRRRAGARAAEGAPRAPNE